MYSESDALFMRRAIFLAEQGLGSVSPNPMVGAVLVYNNTILGEGYHRYYGGPHAEVYAIQEALQKHPDLVSQSRLYVTLEPCAHFGKTPPCADLIIKHKIPKVFVATVDPNPLVSGKGIDRLKNHGIEVHVGLCEKEAKWMNRRFLTFIQKKRPYIILKWAQTANGYLAPIERKQTWISSEASKTLVHLWRSQEDAFGVGYNTVLTDNPSLTTRLVVGKNPVRVVFYRSGTIPWDANIWNTETKTYLLCTESEIDIQSKEITVQYFASEEFLEQSLKFLAERGVQSFVIEGGPKLLNSFIEQKLWDEARVCTNRELFWAQGIAVNSLHGEVFERMKVHTDEWVFYVRC